MTLVQQPWGSGGSARSSGGSVGLLLEQLHACTETSVGAGTTAQVWFAAGCKAHGCASVRVPLLLCNTRSM